MKNVSHKKIWRTGAVQSHVDPPLIGIKKNEKLDKDCVKIKLCRHTTSEKLYLCEFKTTLLENSDPQEFLLFIWIFQTNLEDSGALTDSANINYFCTLLHVEVLRQLGTLSFEVGSKTMIHLSRIILGSGTYFPQ